MRLFAILASLALCACSAGGGANADADRPVSSGTPAPQASAEPAGPAQALSLTGEWRVAGIDGREIDRAYGLALSGNAERLWWEPGCAGQGLGYAISGNRFTPVPPDPAPRAVCDIGFPPEVPQIWVALMVADRIERTEAGGIRISGGGRSVLLFSQ